MSKIIEKILEPSKIETGSNFLLKIKAIRYIIYSELKIQDYNYLKSIKYSDLKGE